MARPTLDDIFSELDEFGLLEVKAGVSHRSNATDRGVQILNEATAFFRQHGHLPDPDASDHEEMRLGTIWRTVSESPTETMQAADTLGLLTLNKSAAPRSWRDAPIEDEIPDTLDDIFNDDSLSIDAELISLKHTTPSAERHVPDHRAEFVPCHDFELFRERFEAIERELGNGERKATPVKKWAVIEPSEGDLFIRNGLIALIAEKSEMTSRSGSRDYRLRVIFSNGTESDPLMSSFRKSLTEDKTARIIRKPGLGPLDPDWEADQLELSGTIYVARSLSDDPTIKSQRDILYKIGVTSQDVRRRVADARNDPTFLLAPVEIVATYELKSLARNKIENLLHRFFANARPAELVVKDRFGKAVHPQEWFYVLPEHVSQAAKLIGERKLHLYRYDPLQQRIVAR